MKLKQEFVVRNVAGDNVLIPVVNCGDTFQGLITMNETGLFIWDKITKEYEREDIINAMLEEYEIDYDTAKININDFCDQLVTLGILYD